MFFLCCLPVYISNLATSSASEEDLDAMPARDVKIIMGDVNANVDKANIANHTHGVFGLGEQNEQGCKMVELCGTHDLIITNTLFQQHPRQLCTWTEQHQIGRQETRMTTSCSRSAGGAASTKSVHILELTVEHTIKY